MFPELVPLVLEGPGPFCLIGDIHGCNDELRDLIDYVLWRYPTVKFISLGDVCDRGPDVSDCFKALREWDSEIVLGNHDEKLLRWAKGSKVQIGPGQQISLQSMSPQDFEDLKRMHPFIRLPFYKAIAVHGGFHAHIPPEKQDLKQIIRLRYIQPMTTKMYTLAAGEGDQGVFWAEAWKGPEHVYFGHAWAEKVQRFPMATGLDTGCVYGNMLTGLVLHSEGETLVQIPAKKVYWADKHGE